MQCGVSRSAAPCWTKSWMRVCISQTSRPAAPACATFATRVLSRPAARTRHALPRQRSRQRRGTLGLRTTMGRGTQMHIGVNAKRRGLALHAMSFHRATECRTQRFAPRFGRILAPQPVRVPMSTWLPRALQCAICVLRALGRHAQKTPFVLGSNLRPGITHTCADRARLRHPPQLRPQPPCRRYRQPRPRPRHPPPTRFATTSPTCLSAQPCWVPT
jgi:hypothetical protein